MVAPGSKNVNACALLSSCFGFMPLDETSCATFRYLIKKIIARSKYLQNAERKIPSS